MNLRLSNTAGGQPAMYAAVLCCPHAAHSRKEPRKFYGNAGSKLLFRDAALPLVNNKQMSFTRPTARRPRWAA